MIDVVPRISEFYGIVIEMYYADHPPPHFHARYGDDSGQGCLIQWRSDRGVAPSPRAATRARMGRGPPGRTRGELGADCSSREAGADRTTPMREIVFVTDVEPLHDYWIRATFTDGAV